LPQRALPLSRQVVDVLCDAHVGHLSAITLNNLLHTDSVTHCFQQVYPCGMQG
jgi:hypothetical protein